MRDLLKNAVDGSSEEMIQLAKKIFDSPELGLNEHKAVQLLTTFLKNKGFSVTQPLCGLDTAFHASLGHGSPHVALLCEYDALPEIGHACGHHMIGTISAGAAAAFAELECLPADFGKISVIGCPAEETQNTKGMLVKQGVFNDVDSAFLIHPADMSTGFDISYGVQTCEIEFFGKPAHAASDPVHGVNALDAMISTFNGIGLLRQRLPEKTRVHGIITNGGQSSNTIPEYTSAELSVRALDMEMVYQLSKELKKIAEGAAKMTNCRLKYRIKKEMVNVRTNSPLAEALERNYLENSEQTVRRTYEQGVGSTDMGEVTQAIPAVHAYINITGGMKMCPHTREFALKANSDHGYQAMVRATKALALTVFDVMTDHQLLKDARRFFQSGVTFFDLPTSQPE